MELMPTSDDWMLWVWFLGENIGHEFKQSNKM